MPPLDAPPRPRTYPVPRRLALTLLLCAGCAVLFLLLTSWVADGSGLHEFDLSVAASFRSHADANPVLLDFFRVLTHAGDGRTLTLVALAGVVVSLALRRYRLALIWLVVTSGASLLSDGLKEAINRPRPPLAIRDESVDVHNPSFPSGHSLGALVCYGMLGYSLRPGWARRAGVALLALLVLGIGLSRLYLRAHFGGDVVAGFAAGLAWLAFCLAVMWMFRPISPSPLVGEGRGEGDLVLAEAGSPAP
jgi:undecaprenyl-diphosphatase